MKRIAFLFSALLVAIVASAEIKYIFYFIGDGMGANQVLATEMYLAECEGRIGRKQLNMTQMPYTGQVSTFSDSNGITDSSAAGTCLATGSKTTNGKLGVDPDNQPLESVAARLKKQGYGVGIMTSVSIDHATPGAFYAHVPDRGNYYNIGIQLAKSGFDFFGGASFLQPVNPNDSTAPNLYGFCENNGYTFARGYADARTKMDAKKLILIQKNDGSDVTQPSTHKLPYAIDKQNSDLTLPQLTETAIQYLTKHHDRFFMMVEGGAIDWACHGNDAATVIRDVIEFDDAIEVAFRFYMKHPDETLIIVTADHETGGMSLGNSDYTLNLKALQNQRVSSDVLTDDIKALHAQYANKLKWKQVKAYLSDNLGLYTRIPLSKEQDAALQAQFKKMMKNKADDVKTLYKDIDGLSNEALRIINKDSKIGWTTGSHTASAVPVFAVGAGAQLFTGWHDNKELTPLIIRAMEQNK